VCGKDGAPNLVTVASYLTMMGCKEKAAAKMQLRMGQTRRSYMHATTTHISALLFSDIHKWHDRRAMLITMTPSRLTIRREC
jgi:hypothetical protein